MARRVRFFADQIQKEKDVIPIRPLYDSSPLITVGPRAAQTIDDLERALDGYEKKLQDLNQSYQSLSAKERELIEAKHVLRETAAFFDKARAFVLENSHLALRLSFSGSGTPIRN